MKKSIGDVPIIPMHHEYPSAGSTHVMYEFINVGMTYRMWLTTVMVYALTQKVGMPHPQQIIDHVTQCVDGIIKKQEPPNENVPPVA